MVYNYVKCEQIKNFFFWVVLIKKKKQNSSVAPSKTQKHIENTNVELYRLIVDS